MKLIKIVCALSLVLFCFISCGTDYIVNIPEVSEETSEILKRTKNLSDFSKSEINGVYEVISGKNYFGDQVVLKWSGDYLSIFAGKNASYIILQGGKLDTLVYWAGYWRFATGSETGIAAMKINYSEGASDLFSNQDPAKIIIRGYYKNGEKGNEQPFIIRHIRPLKDISEGFHIIAHRGGGRNSDRLPASENSLEIIPWAERYGANAIEIDVRLTKDDELILYHDENFNTRLVNGEYFIGPVINYRYYPTIRNYCKLKNGEQIPTLKEALETVAKTDISLVWLDVKSPGVLDALLDVMDKVKNVDFEILIGIPTRDILDKYLSDPKFMNFPALCELSLDEVRQAEAEVWGPRWTLGTMLSEVEAMHSEGRRVFVWTLDLPEFIYDYLNNGNFDGILTNYPSLVAYEYYVQE